MGNTAKIGCTNCDQSRVDHLRARAFCGRRRWDTQRIGPPWLIRWSGGRPIRRKHGEWGKGIENGWSTLVTTVTTMPGIMHFSWKCSGYTPFVQNLLDHVGTHTDQPLSRGAMFRKSVGCAWKTVQCCNTSRRRQVEVSKVMEVPQIIQVSRPF
jgi:hypothetical protein